MEPRRQHGIVELLPRLNPTLTAGSWCTAGTVNRRLEAVGGGVTFPVFGVRPELAEPGPIPLQDCTTH